MEFENSFRIYQKKLEELMVFLPLIKDLISMVVIANAVTGHNSRDMSKSYLDTLEKIVSLGKDEFNNSWN